MINVGGPSPCVDSAIPRLVVLGTIRKQPGQAVVVHLGGRGRRISEFSQPGLQSEFQDIQGYTEKPCLEKKTKQNKTKQKQKQKKTKPKNQNKKTNPTTTTTKS